MNHGRKWEVRHGDYSAFSDAATAEEAIADVHRGAVNNALYLNTPESRSANPNLPGSSFPPAAVLAEYPDLVEKFPDAVPAPELGHQPGDQVLTVAERTASQYEAMKAADEAFQRELVRAYGEDNAGDARYKPRLDDEAVQMAGDAFVAGFLSGHLDGLALRERLVRAAEVAGFVVGTRGDWEGAPRRTELALLSTDDGTTLR